ncbi:MAG: tetratricopeptide repeat protein [Casimicrobiaceae bacterium]
MTFDRYTEWLTRGRAHQAGHRMIDALLCYRRALREAPRGIDAQFHIGEIAWHMGNPADAIAAWRTTSTLSPAHLASWHALADACAATGELRASLDAVTHVLAMRPDEPRVNALRVLLAAATAQSSDASLADAVRSGTSWPLLLLARVIEHALVTRHYRDLPQGLPALLDAARAAMVTRGNEDALRRIALALGNAGAAESGQMFADRYAEACRALHRSPMPLRWPLRTADKALRVGILTGEAGDADALRVALSDAGLDDNVRCTVLAAADASTLPGVDAVKDPPAFGDAAARSVAALDVDVLIDLAGTRLASGPLLALHPARVLWSVARPGTPALRAFADRMFTDADAFPAALASDLRELQTLVAKVPRSAVTAEELSACWEEAVRAHQRGDLAAAREGYARVLDAQPGHAPALYLAGVVARTANDHLTARECFDAAIDSAPDYADARIALVTSLVDAGDPADAAAIARVGLDLDAASAALWRALGQAELKRGDAAAAVAAFDEALKRDPTDGEAHYNHGVALQTARHPAEAARAYQRALAFRPDLVAADFNLGVLFDQQGNPGAAIAAYSNVLERVPNDVAAYKALAETLLASGRIDAWFANFERFEQHCPGHLTVAVHALEVCAYRADFARLERYLDGLRQGHFTADPASEMLDALQQLLYLLHFFDVEPELVGRYARLHDALARKLYGEPWPSPAHRRPGKLRIGYLSGDFRNHVMGKMMWEALRHHDRARFDIVGYATGDARDEWTARFESACSSFQSVGPLSDRAAAQRIADDDLDVLVDLSTHTKGARPGILALKPARVQITHVASAGTLAMSAIDFKLTDQYADTPDDPAPRIEPLLAMDGCVYPYRHVAASATPVFKRAALKIPHEGVVIGAFCTPLKLSQRCLALWREVLTRVPNAVLAFSPVHPALRDVFHRIAAIAGIEMGRIVFVPQGRDDAENQARYRLIDFVLDPLPYGGVNGTLEALDMDVPVVTLVGRRHAERTSYSILANLGVTDTIAQTGGDYVAIAARLATDRAFMRNVRERIAAGLRHSPLTDMEAHTRHLEAAYVKALEMRVPESLESASA